MMVSMVTPAHPADDMIIELTADGIDHIVKFIRANGLDADISTSSRDYRTEGPGVWKMGSVGLAKRVKKDGAESDHEDTTALSSKRFKMVSGTRKGCKNPSTQLAI